jgi:NAD(P)-dependent dehydrogenase (short-subunit alcohol dehydrogenase family)
MTQNNDEAVMLITGGSRGIGAATAQLAARGGWRVMLSYRDDRRAADQVVSSIVAAGGRASAVQADVGREDDVLAMFGTLDAQGGRLGALVNNAGIVAPAARVDAFDLARMERVFRTNVIGSFLCAREAVRRMSSRHGGRGGAIVNLSSVAARLGSPAEYVDYAASKGAIDTMTVGLAKEVATEGIRVNAVRPGLILTEIHASGGDAGRVERLLGQVPMRRAGSADEVAQSIVWLCSPQSGYVTGAVLDVGGGR